MKNTLLVITCLSFAACGGGGSGNGPTTVESSVLYVAPAGIPEYEVILPTKSTFRAAACDFEGRHVLAGKNAGMGFLTRYMPTGEPDSTFGWVFLSQVVEWRSLAIQADGTIVAMGHKPDGTTVVALYAPNGSLKATTSLSFPGILFWGAAMAIESTTKRIVVAGMAQPSEGGERDGMTAVVTPEGNLDPSFGSPKEPGRWRLSIPGDDTFEAVTWSEGKIVAGGTRLVNDTKHALLALLPENASDWSLTVDKTGGLETKITDLEVLNGTILAAVSTLDKLGGLQCGVWRYDSEGILDPMFVKTFVKDVSGSGDPRLALQPDGSILLTASDKAARVLKNGGLDESFVLGKAEHVFFDILLTPANKILVAGIDDPDGSKAWFAQYR